MREGILILALILPVEVAPVSRDVPSEKWAGRLARREECSQRARCGHYCCYRIHSPHLL
jgi:hypothetical protein